MNFSRQAFCLPSFKPSRAGLNVTSRWPDTSDFHSPISALVPRPKFKTPSWGSLTSANEEKLGVGCRAINYLVHENVAHGSLIWVQVLAANMVIKKAMMATKEQPFSFLG